MRKKEKGIWSNRADSDTAAGPSSYDGAPDTIRTYDTRFRRAVLYPLSYGGITMDAREPVPDGNSPIRKHARKGILAVFAEQ